MLPARRLADFWYFVVTGDPGGRASSRAANRSVSVGVTQRSIGSILGFENDPAAAGRGRDPSPALGHCSSLPLGNYPVSTL